MKKFNHDIYFNLIFMLFSGDIIHRYIYYELD